MKRKPNILFTATFSTSFIQEDIALLKKNYSLSVIINYGITTLLRYFKEIQHNDVTFSWFASVYSSLLIAFAKLFNKKSVLVLGGIDVADLKEYNYGIWNSRWKSIIVRYGIMHADVVLAVDEFIKKEAMRLAKYDGNNIRVLPTGYDGNFWQPHGKKESSVLMVASCPDMVRVKIKGVDFFLDVATHNPNVQFILVGVAENISSQSQLQIPTNVKIIPKISKNELLSHYQKAKVYAQLSFREGLPNALCEAMLCECVPIGTNVGGIPTAIGTTGNIIPYGDVSAATTAIKNALSDSEAGKNARKRILQFFTIDEREQQLQNIISNLTKEIE